MEWNEACILGVSPYEENTQGTTNAEETRLWDSLLYEDRVSTLITHNNVDTAKWMSPTYINLHKLHDVHALEYWLIGEISNTPTRLKISTSWYEWMGWCLIIELKFEMHNVISLTILPQFSYWSSFSPTRTRVDYITTKENKLKKKDEWK